MKMDAHSNDPESLTTPYQNVAIAGFLRRQAPVTGSLFEKLIGGGTLGTLLRHVGLQPADLVPHKLHALAKLLDRLQAQVLPDLVRDLFLWPVVVVDSCHGSPPRPGIYRRAGGLSLWRGPLTHCLPNQKS